MLFTTIIFSLHNTKFESIAELKNSILSMSFQLPARMPADLLDAVFTSCNEISFNVASCQLEFSLYANWKYVFVYENFLILICWYPPVTSILKICRKIIRLFSAYISEIYVTSLRNNQWKTFKWKTFREIAIFFNLNSVSLHGRLDLLLLRDKFILHTG